MKYSPTTKMFYDPDVAYLNLPNDLVEITNEIHQSALQTKLDGGSFTFENDEIVLSPVDPQVLADKQKVKDWQDYQAQAKILLIKSDTTLLRCYEAGVALPTEWATYRKDLRTILSTAAGIPQTLPTQPTYPQGT
jgi:hypothetical protein